MFHDFRQLLVPVLLIAGAVLLPACGGPDEQDHPSETLAEAVDDTAMEHALKHLDEKYVCPMHPQIILDEPGSCPICGMDLVLKQIDAATDKRPTVTVRGEIIQSMGVRTATVERDTLWRFVQTVGRVTYDETVLSHVHPRAEGWMEQLAVRAEGDPVEAGRRSASSTHRRSSQPRWISWWRWAIRARLPGNASKRRATGCAC